MQWRRRRGRHAADPTDPCADGKHSTDGNAKRVAERVANRITDRISDRFTNGDADERARRCVRAIVRFTGHERS